MLRDVLGIHKLHPERRKYLYTTNIYSLPLLQARPDNFDNFEM